MPAKMQMANLMPILAALVIGAGYFLSLGSGPATPTPPLERGRGLLRPAARPTPPDPFGLRPEMDPVEVNELLRRGLGRTGLDPREL